MLDQLRLIMQALPWTGPALVGGALLGMLSMFFFPRRRSLSDRIGLALLLWCLTLALVVTLSPVRNNYFGIPSQGCDWSIWSPLDVHYWFSSGSRPPNVWLFAPAGVGVMLLDRVWRKIFGAIFLLALPIAIETVQDYEPALKRSCSSQDVVDNWTGLVLGLGVGLVLASLIGIVRFFRRRSERKNAIIAPAEPGLGAGASQAYRDEDSDAHERLPLSGRSANTDFDEFSDFDDGPRSTVYHEQAAYDPDATTVLPQRGDDDPDATREFPRPRR